MDDLGKLKHLLEHWAEHNAGHADGYLEWAGRARQSGREDLSQILVEVAEGTRKLNLLLEKASGLLRD